MKEQAFERAREVQRQLNKVREQQVVLNGYSWLQRACEMSGLDFDMGEAYIAADPAKAVLVPPCVLAFKRACLDKLESRRQALQQEFDAL